MNSKSFEADPDATFYLVLVGVESREYSFVNVNRHPSLFNILDYYAKRGWTTYEQLIEATHIQLYPNDIPIIDRDINTDITDEQIQEFQKHTHESKYHLDYLVGNSDYATQDITGCFRTVCIYFE